MLLAHFSDLETMSAGLGRAGHGADLGSTPVWRSMWTFSLALPLEVLLTGQ